MDEHERTVKAARQVDLRIGFYVHFVVFLSVCGGLVVANLLATPEIWWAQWPLLGWGIGVLGHALCAFGFGSGPSFITRWRLRKIRELTHPEAAAAPSSRDSGAGKTIATLLLGILIGCAAGGGYMYTLLQDARENARTLQVSRDELDKSLKDEEARLKQVASEKSSLEETVKETKDQLGQLQSLKQAVEQALQKARDELVEAQSVREAAERAQAEAKKGASQ